MAENVYEGMFIFDSNRYAREPSAIPGEIDKLIESAGGEMLSSRLWEERRLAYPIKRQRKGTYWLTYFRLGTDQLIDINRQVEINDNVLRHLILKIDPRLVDAMVAHASGVVEEEPAAEDKPAADKPAEDKPAEDKPATEESTASESSDADTAVAVEAEAATEVGAGAADAGETDSSEAKES